MRPILILLLPSIIACPPALSDDDASASDDDTVGDDDSTSGDDDSAPGELRCPETIDVGILGCVADLRTDPEASQGLHLIDLLLMCSDAEPAAVAYDQWCAATPDDPICGLDYFVFVSEVLPQCTDRAREQLFAGVCLLPTEYSELLPTPGVALVDRRFISDAATLDSAENAQVIATSMEIGFEVGTAADAFSATDDGGMEMLTVLAVGTDRMLTLWTAHYGDTRAGRMWFRGMMTRAATVLDSSFAACAIERGTEGQPCWTPEDPACGEDHACTGIVTDELGQVLAPGACRATGEIDGAGAECDADFACAAGLLCIPYGAGAPLGQCNPGWMRRTFAGPSQVTLVAGGTTRIPILVSGLAAVPAVAQLDLVIGQGVANGLVITLENPFGTAVPVLDTNASPTMDVVLDLAEVAVPGDEVVNGEWALVVQDVGGQASGGVWLLGLTLDSRWD